MPFCLENNIAYKKCKMNLQLFNASEIIKKQISLAPVGINILCKELKMFKWETITQ